MLRRPAAFLMPTTYKELPVRIDEHDLVMRFHALMREHGVTVRDLADYLNLKVPTVQWMLQGESDISVNFLISFCAAVGCSITDVLPFANDVLRYPYKYVVPGGGGADDIAPDPYKIVLPDPDIVSSKWEEAPK